MGFKKPNKTIKLTFDGDLEGLEVSIKSPTVKTALFMQTLQTIGDEESVKGLAEALADHIVSWNLEDDKGKVLKATYNELVSLPLDMFQSLMTKWIENTMGVPVPLESSSATTNKQVEELIPMDV